VGDNATSNDSELIKGLNLHPNINITSNHRIRCVGHIINLIVKATIYGQGVSKWEEELAAAAPLQSVQEVLQAWGGWQSSQLCERSVCIPQVL
jgi:hypothetical protein